MKFCTIRHRSWRCSLTIRRICLGFIRLWAGCVLLVRQNFILPSVPDDQTPCLDRRSFNEMVLYIRISIITSTPIIYTLERKPYPEAVYPSLGCIPVQPFTIRISWQSVHNRPRHRTRLGELQSKIIVRSSNGMVMLMDHKMATSGMAVSTIKINVVLDCQTWSRLRNAQRPRVLAELG